MSEITYGNWKGNRDGILATRELQFVLGLANGKTQKQIARDMNCSPKNVSVRLQNVYFKLGVNRAPAAVAEAIRRGIIAPLMILVTVIGLWTPQDFPRVHRSRTNARIVRMVRQYEQAA